MKEAQKGINIFTGNEDITYSENENIYSIQNEFNNFLEFLQTPNNRFDPETAFQMLYTYLLGNKRILYSMITTVIYARYQQNTVQDPVGTLLANLDALTTRIPGVPASSSCLHPLCPAAARQSAPKVQFSRVPFRHSARPLPFSSRGKS